MFPARYFPPGYWPARYWPKVGAIGTGGPYWPRAFWPASYFPAGYWGPAASLALPDNLLAALGAVWSATTDLAAIGTLHLRRKPAGVAPPYAVVREKRMETIFHSGDTRIDDYRVTFRVVATTAEQAEGLGDVVEATYGPNPLDFVDGTMLAPWKTSRLDDAKDTKGPGNTWLYYDEVEFSCRVLTKS